MKKVILFLSCLFILTPHIMSQASCLDEALAAAKKLPNKVNIVFVEGTYWPAERHVQLWVWEKGRFKILAGEVDEKWKFRGTDFYTYNEYMYKHRDLLNLSP